jgi:hypothetical protein
MALMFDVRPTYIYRHLCWRYTWQLAIADRDNVIIKVVVRIIGNSELVKIRCIAVGPYSYFFVFVMLRANFLLTGLWRF